MRVISRIDIKNNHVIKGINLEGLRKIGEPLEIATKYYTYGVDEIILIDAVASLYKRNNLFDVVKEATKNIFVPLTLGGGLRNLKDIENALKSGADKVALNSYVTENPNFIKEAVKNFGSSTITIYIEAKKIDNKKWEIYKHYGRERTNIDLLYWIEKIQEFECGEILLTSIDYEGLMTGLDFDLINHVYNKIRVPFIYSGGVGNKNHLINLKKQYRNFSIALASALHYGKINLKNLDR